MGWKSIYEAGGADVVSRHIGKRAKTKDGQIGKLEVSGGHFCVVDENGERIGLAEEIEIENND